MCASILDPRFLESLRTQRYNRDNRQIAHKRHLVGNVFALFASLRFEGTSRPDPPPAKRMGMGPVLGSGNETSTYARAYVNCLVSFPVPMSPYESTCQLVSFPDPDPHERVGSGYETTCQ